MNKYYELEEVIDFIKKTHRQLSKGLYCLKLLRKPDGTRIPVEELRGVRIENWTIYDKNTLIIHQHSHGTPFRGRALHTFDAILYLPDLTMINVYDYSAEFLTSSSIDFVYLQQSKEAKTVMLAEWIHDVPRNLRAQWFRDEETEMILGEVGLGRRIRSIAPLGRHLDLGSDDL